MNWHRLAGLAGLIAVAAIGAGIWTFTQRESEETKVIITDNPKPDSNNEMTLVQLRQLCKGSAWGLSDHGELKFVWHTPNGRFVPGTLYLIKPNGEKIQMAEGTNDIGSGVSVAPDSSRFVFNDGGKIFIANRDGTGKQQLVSNSEVAVYDVLPKWSPRGDYIMFEREYSDARAIYLIKPDGTGLQKVSVQDRTRPYLPWYAMKMWSSTGEYIAFVGYFYPGGPSDSTAIYKVRVDVFPEFEEFEPHRVDLVEPFVEPHGTTQDGEWMAFKTKGNIYAVRWHTRSNQPIPITELC